LFRLYSATFIKHPKYNIKIFCRFGVNNFRFYAHYIVSTGYKPEQAVIKSINIFCVLDAKQLTPRFR